MSDVIKPNGGTMSLESVNQLTASVVKILESYNKFQDDLKSLAKSTDLKDITKRQDGLDDKLEATLKREDFDATKQDINERLNAAVKRDEFEVNAKHMNERLDAVVNQEDFDAAKQDINGGLGARVLQKDFETATQDINERLNAAVKRDEFEVNAKHINERLDAVVNQEDFDAAKQDINERLDAAVGQTKFDTTTKDINNRIDAAVKQTDYDATTKKINNRLDAVATKQKDICNANQDINNRLGAVVKSDEFKLSQDNFDKLKERVEECEDTLPTLITLEALQDKAIDDLKADCTKSNRSFTEELTKQMKIMNEKLDDMRKANTDLESEQKRLQSENAALKTWQETIDKQLKDLQDKAAAKDNVFNQVKQMAEGAASVTELTKLTETMKTLQKTLEDSVNKQEFAAFKETLGPVGEDMKKKANSHDLDSIYCTLNEHEKKFADVAKQAELDSLVSTVDEHREKLNTVSKQTDLDSLRSGVEDHRKKLDKTAKQEDLDSLTSTVKAHKELLDKKVDQAEVTSYATALRDTAKQTDLSSLETMVNNHNALLDQKAKNEDLVSLKTVVDGHKVLLDGTAKKVDFDTLDSILKHHSKFLDKKAAQDDLTSLGTMVKGHQELLDKTAKQDAFDSLNSTVKEYGKLLDNTAKQQDLTSLRTQVESNNDDLISTKTIVESCTENLAKTQAAVNTLGTDLQSIPQRVTTLEKDMETVKPLSEKFGQSIESATATANAQGERIGKLEVTIETQEKALGLLKNVPTSLKNFHCRTSELDVRLKSTDSVVERVKRKVANLHESSREDIIALYERQEDTKVKTAKVKAYVKTIEPRLQQVMRQVHDVQWQIQDMNTESIERMYNENDLAIKFGEDDATMARLVRGVDAQQYLLDDIQVNVAEATIDTAQLEDSHQATERIMSGITDRLQTLEDKMVSLEDAPEYMTTENLTELESSIQQAHHEQGKLSNEIEQITKLPGLVDNLREQLKTVEQELDYRTCELAGISERVESLEGDFGDCEQAATGYKSLKKKVNALQQTRDQCNNLKERVDELQQALEVYNNHAELNQLELQHNRLESNNVEEPNFLYPEDHVDQHGLEDEILHHKPGDQGAQLQEDSFTMVDERAAQDGQGDAPLDEDEPILLDENLSLEDAPVADTTPEDVPPAEEEDPMQDVEDDQEDDQEEEEAITNVTIWVNQDGKLVTNSEVDREEAEALKDAWQEIKRQFDSKSRTWTSINLKNKCVWGTVVCAPTTHYWTRKRPGQFACRSCANKRRICVGRVGQRLQILPLPPVPPSAKHSVTSLITRYVAEAEYISRRTVQVWDS